MPLKISPKNTWVKINTFDTPCRLLEISTQSLNIEIKNLPEASTMQAGNNIKIQVLNASGEDPLVLHVTIFHINDTECLCQVPLYVDSEQILLDKIVLEIQKMKSATNIFPALHAIMTIRTMQRNKITMSRHQMKT